MEHDINAILNDSTTLTYEVNGKTIQQSSLTDKYIKIVGKRNKTFVGFINISLNHNNETLGYELAKQIMEVVIDDISKTTGVALDYVVETANTTNTVNSLTEL